jgi:DNA-binding NtrC family response regulator
MATGGIIRPEHLALDAVGPATGSLETLADVTARHVAAVLAATGGNKTRAAEILDISRPRLRRILEKHGLDE